MTNVIADIGLPGLSVYRNAALKATKQSVKTGKARCYGWKIQNLDSAEAYFHIYDALAANVTVGTTTPKISIWLPASGGDDLVLPRPIAFNTGFVVAATTTLGGSGAPTNGELVNLLYY